MNPIVVQFENNELAVLDQGDRLFSRRVGAEAAGMFQKWIDSYNHAIRQDKNEAQLFKIGRALYGFLDNSQGWLTRRLRNSIGPFLIEFQIPVQASPAENAFLEVPWELLAGPAGHLAKDQNLKFSPVRRIGAKGKKERPPSPYKLLTVFMAAAPRKVEPELAYEREESLILNLHAEKAARMDLFVEESGNLAQLIQMVADLKPVDVVHISCHGNIEYRDPKTGPYLCLETVTGELDTVTADEFERKYSQNRPALLFLSACQTAAAYAPQSASGQAESGAAGTGAFAPIIVKRGFPAVIGWSGSVSDYEAARFAGEFYRNLSLSATLEDAVAMARFSLFTPPEGGKKPPESRDWHLARLYLGAQGGGILTGGNQERFLRKVDAGEKEFLGKKEKGLEVASRKEFVGRRRELQAILREFQEPAKAGVLIHGPGHLGKSSLAARVANRLHTHQLVLIYGKKGDERMYTAYHALNEFKSIADFAATKKIDDLLREIAANENYFAAALKELLEGPFSGKDPAHPPVLVIIDDLEKVLAPPQSATLYQVQRPYQEALKGIISAFHSAQTKSRLLITSRYDFELFDDGGRDIAGMLRKIPLSSMKDADARKQYLAKYGAMEKGAGEIALESARVVDACQGNPGLQNLMFNLFHSAPEQYRKALQAMEDYLKSGEEPDEQNIQDFLRDLAIDNILALLTGGEQGLLQAAALFAIPVPREVFKAIAGKIGIATGIDYEKRLLGFGVMEQYEDLVDPGRKSWMLNKIVRPRVQDLPGEVAAELAGIISDSLFAIWGKDQDSSRPWICDREMVRFALQAGHWQAVAHCAENCLRGMDASFLIKEAAAMAVDCLALLEEKGQNVPAGLYKIASDVCHVAGKVDLALGYVKKILSATREDSFTKASAYLRLGRILEQKGQVAEAVEFLAKAQEIFKKEKEDHGSAIALGDIARIKVNKGEVEEALRLHQKGFRFLRNWGTPVPKPSRWEILPGSKQIKARWRKRSGCIRKGFRFLRNWGT
ncbi:MAG: CHAT domain-containing protein [Firmicutes bacterium]|nr:CHAT domain-containing protein [Bacillota bacterium]